MCEAVVCSECLKGKHHREYMPLRSLWRASRRLELIHSDICGPISPTFSTQKRYIICFIDDFRKAWFQFLVSKGEAFNSFKTFKQAIEKETGEFVKCLHTDRVGEFTSNEFSTYCTEHEIQRQLTTVYTPHQSGVAKRKNRNGVEQQTEIEENIKDGVGDIPRDDDHVVTSGDVQHDTDDEDQQDSRVRRASKWMSDYVSGDENDHLLLLIKGEDSVQFDVVVQHEKWRQAMDLEISSIEKNKTWFLTDLPEGAKSISVK
ncbi:hypothetical protein V2J09_022266 [Rumex salicifolius]